LRSSVDHGLPSTHSARMASQIPQHVRESLERGIFRSVILMIGLTTELNVIYGIPGKVSQTIEHGTSICKARDAHVLADAYPIFGTLNAIQAAHMSSQNELMEVLGTKDVGIEAPTPPSSLPKEPS